MESQLSVPGYGHRSATEMMSTAWLDYSVAVDGITIADGDCDGRAHACSELELFRHIELVVNSIEQPHGEGRLKPSHIFDREIGFSDRFDSGDIVSRDELLEFADDVGRYYELSPGASTPRFIETIDRTDPCIDIKANEIQQQIEDMIDGHSGRREVRWNQGTELLFAFASVAVTVIVVLTMALWFKYQS